MYEVVQVTVLLSLSVHHLHFGTYGIYQASKITGKYPIKKTKIFHVLKKQAEFPPVQDALGCVWTKKGACSRHSCQNTINISCYMLIASPSRIAWLWAK
jgi:hypothetical protein